MDTQYQQLNEKDDVVVVGQPYSPAAGAVAVGEPVEHVTKLCFGDSVRLASLDKCTLNCVRAKMAEFYGLVGDYALYALKHEDGRLVKLESDADVKDAINQLDPVKIVAVAPEAVTEKKSLFAAAPAEAPAKQAPAEALAAAAAAIAGCGFPDVTPAELAKVLDALQIQPRRLHKCKLVRNAPPPAYEAQAGAFEESKQEPQAPDAVVAALRARGSLLAPNSIHAVLRALCVAPRRFQRLGLADVNAAREAYKAGLDDAELSRLAALPSAKAFAGAQRRAGYAQAWVRWGKPGFRRGGRRGGPRGDFLEDEGSYVAPPMPPGEFEGEDFRGPEGFRGGHPGRRFGPGGRRGPPGWREDEGEGWRGGGGRRGGGWGPGPGGKGKGGGRGGGGGWGRGGGGGGWGGKGGWGGGKGGGGWEGEREGGRFPYMAGWMRWAKPGRRRDEGEW